MDEKKKIIIVEDEMDFAKMVRMRLQSMGYEVQVALDTYQGTAAILKNTPDLIILDLMMPAGGGYVVLERIRNIPATAAIPVIIMTGKRIGDDDIKKAKEYGVAAIFSKPYNSTKFVETIQSLL